MTLEEALNLLQPPPGYNVWLSKEAIDVVCKAARAYAEIAAAPQTNPPTPAEIKSARLQAYQNGWNDGYAEGRGKALVEAANIAEAYHKDRDTLHSRFTCQRIAAAIRARSET